MPHERQRFFASKHHPRNRLGLVDAIHPVAERATIAVAEADAGSTHRSPTDLAWIEGYAAEPGTRSLLQVTGKARFIIGEFSAGHYKQQRSSIRVIDENPEKNVIAVLRDADAPARFRWVPP